MVRRNRRKNKYNKAIRKMLMLVSLMGALILSYKGYQYYHGKVVQANKSIVVSKVVTTNNTKEVTVKKDIKENVVEDEGKNKLLNVSSDRQKYTYDVKKIKDILDNKGEHDGKK
jgi:hypothetical protein